jgi:hypothetical protein
MYNDTITEHDLLESVRGAITEMLDYHFIDTDTAVTEDFDEALHEYADGLVNVYYTGAVEEWAVAGYPDIEDLGGEYPEHDKNDTTLQRIAREASVAMYYWYHTELTRELEERLNPDEKQAEIDAYLDTPTREDEVK